MSKLFDVKLKKFKTSTPTKLHSVSNYASSIATSNASTVSGELKFSRTCLQNLESLLLRSTNPTLETKKALHKIKIDLNYSKITKLEDTLT